MMKTTLAVLCLAAGVQGMCPRRKPKHCKRGSLCWPEQSDLDTLREALNPEMVRLLANKPEDPLVMAPMLAHEGLSEEENAQPLYGLGLQQMEPLYVRTNLSSTCQDRFEFKSGFCKSHASNVYANVESDFVVFPLTVEHVQTSVAFAKKHRLCIVVVSTGHEFYGRNQPLHCNGGSILIRMTLMKSKEADLEDAAGLGHPSILFGAGNVGAEIQFYAATQNTVVATGDCPTVGIVGWSLGGGHGPYTTFLGIGVDQLLAIDIVLASGKHVRATATNKYSDLLQAMRGGGGSTWGIVTHVAVKAHPMVEMSYLSAIIQAPVTSESAWKTFVNETVMFHGRNGPDASVLSLFFVSGGVFTGQVTGVAKGGQNSTVAQEFIAMSNRAGAMVSSVTPRASTDGYDLPEAELLQLRPTKRPQYLNGALISKDTLADFVDFMSDHVSTNCTGDCLEMLYGRFDGVQGSSTTGLSINHELRTTAGMYLTYAPQATIDARFGPGHVYFSESNPDVPMSRFWDLSTYQSLLRVKNKYDPRRVFGCRRCVGDDTYFSV